MCSAMDYHHSFRAFRAQSLNLINVAVRISKIKHRLIRVGAVKIQRSRFGCAFNRGPHELRERVGRGEEH